MERGKAICIAILVLGCGDGPETLSHTTSATANPNITSRTSTSIAGTYLGPNGVEIGFSATAYPAATVRINKSDLKTEVVSFTLKSDGSKKVSIYGGREIITIPAGASSPDTENLIYSGDQNQLSAMLTSQWGAIIPNLAADLDKNDGLNGSTHAAALQLGLVAAFVSGSTGNAPSYANSTSNVAANECIDLRYFNGNTNNCCGMCGFGCSCWKWVCGDCCCHDGCVTHDVACRSCSPSHPIYCLRWATFDFGSPIFNCGRTHCGGEPPYCGT